MSLQNEPDPQLFLDTSLYRDISSEAQKEFATDVRSPALTWHMSFLITKEIRAVLFDQLDDIFLAMTTFLAKDAGGTFGDLRLKMHPTSNDKLILFGGVYSRNDVMDYLKSKESVSGHLRKIKQYSEAACSDREREILKSPSKLVILSFVWKKNERHGVVNITARVRVSTNMFSITVLAEVDKHVVRGCEKNCAGFEKLTGDFWETDFIEDYILRIPGLRAKLDSIIFKSIFADVRGVVLSEETLRFPNSRFAQGSRKPSWADRLMDGLRPVVTSDDQHECSASYLLDGRALYMTALAPQPLDDPGCRISHNQTDRHRRPLTFLLCVQTHLKLRPRTTVVSEQQLGHLLDRMHLIATLRHAALLDLGLLRRAGERLALLDPIVRDAREALAAYDMREKMSVEAVRKAIEKAHNELNAITNDFLEANPANIGLTFRIESSRYYKSQFEKNLPALRLIRVEGYRRYDHFVERRLGLAFESIDRLGNRYERANSVLSDIDVRFSAIQARRTGSSVAEIQRYGEVLLLSVLVPYYVMGTIDHLYKNDKPPEPLPVIVMFITIIGYAAVRFVDSNEISKPLKKSILKSLLFISAASLIILSFYLKRIGVQVAERDAVGIIAIVVIFAALFYSLMGIVKMLRELQLWMKPTDKKTKEDAGVSSER